jgi:hypothetical protein
MPKQRYPIPPQDVLQALFDYDPDTGVLRFKSTGEEAGHTVLVGPEPYRKNYKALPPMLLHRLIWKLVTGQDPGPGMDHADGDGLNNRWENLRPCTQAENMQNVRRRPGGAREIIGVYRDGNRWRAELQADGKRIRKAFDTPEEAAAWRVAKAKELHGRFYRPPTSIPKT